MASFQRYLAVPRTSSEPTAEAQSELRRCSVIDSNYELQSVASTRSGILEEFRQSEGFDIIILSPFVAGVGLTIVEANHVIHYGRWWNPAVEAQATDRAYRLGQLKEVHVYLPILEDKTRRVTPTFDQLLDQLMENKKGVAEAHSRGMNSCNPGRVRMRPGFKCSRDSKPPRTPTGAPRPSRLAGRQLEDRIQTSSQIGSDSMVSTLDRMDTSWSISFYVLQLLPAILDATSPQGCWIGTA